MILNLTSENFTREQNKFWYTIKRLNSAYISIIIMYTLDIYQKLGMILSGRWRKSVCERNLLQKIRKKNTQKWKIIWHCSRGRSFQNMEVNCRKSCSFLKAGFQDSKDGKVDDYFCWNSILKVFSYFWLFWVFGSAWDFL